MARRFFTESLRITIGAVREGLSYFRYWYLAFSFLIGVCVVALYLAPYIHPAVNHVGDAVRPMSLADVNSEVRLAYIKSWLLNLYLVRWGLWWISVVATIRYFYMVTKARTPFARVRRIVIIFLCGLLFKYIFLSSSLSFLLYLYFFSR